MRRFFAGCLDEPEGEWISYLFAPPLSEIYFSLPKEGERLLYITTSSLAIARVVDPAGNSYRRGSYVVSKWNYNLPGLFAAKRVDSPVLSALYSFPGYRGITIELPDEYWIEGNELFSDVFVERWLRNEVGTFPPFDERYAVQLLLMNEDGEMETRLLRKGQFLRLLANGYEVVEETWENRTKTFLDE